MDVREKLEVIAHLGDHISYKEDIGIFYDSALAKVIEDAYMTLKNGVTVQECPRTLEEWHEDCGDVLWWKFPIEEPPYVGSPLDMAWPGYHTHWTLIPMPLPQPPKGE